MEQAPAANSGAHPDQQKEHPVGDTETEQQVGPKHPKAQRPLSGKEAEQDPDAKIEPPVEQAPAANSGAHPDQQKEHPVGDTETEQQVGPKHPKAQRSLSGKNAEQDPDVGGSNKPEVDLPQAQNEEQAGDGEVDGAKVWPRPKKQPIFRKSRLPDDIQVVLSPEQVAQQVSALTPPEVETPADDLKGPDSTSTTKENTGRQIPKIKVKKPAPKDNVEDKDNGEEKFDKNEAGNDTFSSAHKSFMTGKWIRTVHVREAHESLGDDVEDMLNIPSTDYPQKSDDAIYKDLLQHLKKQSNVVDKVAANQNFAARDLKNAQDELDAETVINKAFTLKARFLAAVFRTAEAEKHAESDKKIKTLKANLRGKQDVAHEANELFKEADSREQYTIQLTTAWKNRPKATREANDKIGEALSQRAFLKNRLNEKSKKVDLVSRRRIIWKLKHFVDEATINLVLNNRGGFRDLGDKFTKSDVRRMFPGQVHESVIDAIFTTNILPIHPDDDRKITNAMTRISEAAAAARQKKYQQRK